MILIDLQKVSNTINHETLLGKLHAIRFSEKTVVWLKSYLSDRAFKVNINNHFSDLFKISFGIPDGSFLDPLILLLYVIDMPQVINSKFFFMQAIQVQHSNIIMFIQLNIN